MAYVPSRLRKKLDWLFKRAEGALLPDAVRVNEAAHLDPDGARLALRACHDDLEVAFAERRFAALLAAPDDPAFAAAYLDTYGVAGVRRFVAGAGTRIYQLTAETFPRHVNNVYLVMDPGSTLLVDCGSGLPVSQRDLALGFAVVRAMFGEDVRWESLDWCLVSHAHSDHFGGVNVLRRTSSAKIAVHELDARVITCFEDRLAAAIEEIDRYWQRAGVRAARREQMRELYMADKHFRSEPVDRTLRDGDVMGPGHRIHHVPGHCPGLVCLQVHDVLLTSDHVLARITPHQFPRSIGGARGPEVAAMGLEPYLRSLAKIRQVDGIRLALGGHEEPIDDLRGRIDEIARFHAERLERVHALCASPSTIHDVAAALFGDQEGYAAILALDEAGAHVEYLHETGRLSVVDRAGGPVESYVARR